MHSGHRQKQKPAARKKMFPLRHHSREVRDQKEAADLVASFAANAIVCYTDGACKGNPGPAGAACVVSIPSASVYEERRKCLGVSTNNISELTGVEMALDTLSEISHATPQQVAGRPLEILTDSRYARGVVFLGWNANKNQQLVETVQKKLARHKERVRVHWVKAHVGIPGNERADTLSDQATRERS